LVPFFKVKVVDPNVVELINIQSDYKFYDYDGVVVQGKAGLFTSNDYQRWKCSGSATKLVFINVKTGRTIITKDGKLITSSIYSPVNSEFTANKVGALPNKEESNAVDNFINGVKKWIDEKEALIDCANTIVKTVVPNNPVASSFK